MKGWLDKLRSREIADDEVKKWEKAEGDAGKSATLENDEDYWRQRSARLDKELKEEKAAAYARGEDPKKREIEAGRMN